MHSILQIIEYVKNTYQEDFLELTDEQILGCIPSNFIIKLDGEEIDGITRIFTDAARLRVLEQANCGKKGVKFDNDAWLKSAPWTEINNLFEKLNDNNDIIINENISKIANVNIGDTLVLESGDKKLEYKVVAINESFMGASAYTIRSNLAKEFENDEMVYNIKFTDDNKYSSMSNLTKEESDKIANILSIEDLQDNLKNQLSASNGSIYVVIGFASVMAFVIILIIANVVVEENKKTISLMKVMGYDDKSVSSIVLNIYTPFIIIAYLLAIPAMKKLLEFIVSKLTGSMDFAIPIEFSWIKALIGLAGLLISYFIAIFISRRVLNKVPLSVALKRE